MADSESYLTRPVELRNSEARRTVQQRRAQKADGADGSGFCVRRSSLTQPLRGVLDSALECGGQLAAAVQSAAAYRSWSHRAACWNAS